jgi:site-specific recombinase XerD
MILMYDTGGRIQEILDLKLNDLALNQDTPCVYLHGKGNKIRVVPLMDKTIDHLKNYLKLFHPCTENTPNDTYLFYTVIKGKQGQIAPDTIALFLKKYAKMARPNCPDVPENIHAHMFRHSRAMHLYQSGIPLSYIKDFLGHVSATTTSIYASADTQMIRAALEKAEDNKTTVNPVWKGDEDMILKLCGLK